MMLTRIVTTGRYLTVLLGLTMLAACAGNPASSLPPLPSDQMSEYTLQSGDQVRVVVFGQDNIPTDYTVDDQGDISMPLVGSIKAAGETTKELESNFKTALTKVIVDPNVSVQLISPRPVYVLGGVNEPGAYPYAKNMTVLSATALANGFTTEAYENDVKVTRLMPDGTQKDFRAGPHDFIRPNDIVFVYEKYKQY